VASKIRSIFQSFEKAGVGSKTISVISFRARICKHLRSLWGLGTEEEEGYRTGPPGYIGYRNSFLGIDSGAPYTFKNTGPGVLSEHVEPKVRLQSKTVKISPRR
jgi:hypothetical protein